MFWHFIFFLSSRIYNCASMVGGADTKWNGPILYTKLTNKIVSRRVESTIKKRQMLLKMEAYAVGI